MAIMSYIQAITTALREEMLRDEKVFILGEDVGKKGGVFRATDGLYEQFGEERVLDTPLAESAIAGVGIGAAMYGIASSCGNAICRFYFASCKSNYFRSSKDSLSFK